MKVFRTLMVLAVAISMTAATIGCGKPEQKRRSAGSAQGTGGTETPKPDAE